MLRYARRRVPLVAASLCVLLLVGAAALALGVLASREHRALATVPANCGDSVRKATGSGKIVVEK